MTKDHFYLTHETLPESSYISKHRSAEALDKAVDKLAKKYPHMEQRYAHGFEGSEAEDMGNSPRKISPGELEKHAQLLKERKHPLIASKKEHQQSHWKQD